MIRKASLTDYETLAALWLETSLAAHGFVSAEYWRKMVSSVQKDYLPNSETYIFEDKHKIKGFISLQENNYTGGLFVLPKWQQCKIGSKLLKFVRRHRPNLSLKVFAKNEQALRFYQKHGFKIVAEQTDVSTGEKELLLGWSAGCLTGFQKRFQGDS